MGHLDLTVHRCDWSSQPSIHILCDDSWTQPYWGHPTSMQTVLAKHDIFVTDDGRYYAFDEEKVTCKKCLEKQKVEAA